LSDSKINIEKIDVSNLHELQIVGRQTFLETFSNGNTEEDMNKYLAEKFSIEQLSNELSNPNSEFYFAKIEKQVVGYLKLNFGQAQTEDNNQDGVEIERIYVLKQYHGRKVGQVLYNKALEIAKEKKADYVWLGVWDKNPRAIRFYEKNGFIEYDKHVFVLGIEKQTDIMMKLKL
jgi:ribosomal protein S18 acetylase RimI-like enzyme